MTDDLETKECPQCERDFPVHLIQPLYISQSLMGGGYRDSCPICALKITNELHEMKRTKFTGTMAQEALEEAQDWLDGGDKRHGES